MSRNDKYTADFLKVLWGIFLIACPDLYEIFLSYFNFNFYFRRLLTKHKQKVNTL